MSLRPDTDLVIAISDRDNPSKQRDLTGWLSYQVSHNIHAGGVPVFSAMVSPTKANRELIGIGGQRCWVYLDGAFQFAGILDERSEDCSLTAADLSVSGRGMAGQLVDSDIPPGMLSLAGLTLEAVAKRWIEPWSDLVPGVTTNYAASRYIVAGGGASGQSGTSDAWDPAGLRQRPPVYKLREGSARGPAKPFGKSSPYYRGIDREQLRQVTMDPGTKVWEGLAKLCGQIGAALWSGCDGTVVIGKPSYDADPKACYGVGLRIEWDSAQSRYKSGNVVGFRVETTCAERASEYLLVGTSKSSKKAKGKQVVKNWSEVRDPSPAFWKRQSTPPYLTDNLLYRPRVLDVKGVLDPKCIKRIAMRVMEEAAIRAISMEYQVNGHLGPAGLLWTPDSMVELFDERHDLYGPHWIAGRDFGFESQGQSPTGRTTKLKLYPPEVWLPSFDPDTMSADAYTQWMMHRIWW